MKPFLYLAFVGLALSACGDGDRTADRCQATRHGDWSNDCLSVYAMTQVSVLPGQEPLTHVLTFDGTRFHVAVLITRSRYERFFTDRPVTQLVIGRDEYVADPNYFVSEGGGAMQIGDARFSLKWDGDPHLIAASGDTDRILEALTASAVDQVTVAYARTMGGEAFVQIPVRGLKEAVEPWD